MPCKLVNFGTGTGAIGTLIQVTGVGFRPQFILFFGSGDTGTVNTVARAADLKFLGFMAEPLDAHSIANVDPDAVDPTVSTGISGHHDQVSPLLILNTGGGTDGAASPRSMDGDGFSLEVTNAFSVSFRVFALCFRGFERITGGMTKEPSGTGNVSITGLGFRPDIVFFIHSMASGDPPATHTDARFMFGAITATDQGTVCCLEDRGTTNRHRLAISTECQQVIAEVTKTTESRVQRTSIDSDGYTLNWLKRITSQRWTQWVAIKGGRWKIGNFLTRTDTTRIQVEGVGFRPDGVFFISNGKAESVADTTDASAKISIGAATSSSERAAVANFDLDAVNPTQVSRGMKFDAIYERIVDTGGADEGLMDYVSPDIDGFTTVMTDADPDAAFVLFIAFAELEAPFPERLIAPVGFNNSLAMGTPTRIQVAV